MPTVFKVDDRDQSVTFSAGWDIGGVPQEFASTAKGTNKKGSKAIVLFTGTRISVFGTVTDKDDGDEQVTTYKIDGGPPATVTLRPENSARYQVQFWQSPEFARGQHTLEVEAALEGPRIVLDYFEVTDDPPVGGAAPSSSPLPQPSSLPLNGAQGQGGLSNVELGLVIGQALQAVLVLLALSLLVVLLLRRRKGRSNEDRRRSYLPSFVEQIPTPYTDARMYTNAGFKPSQEVQYPQAVSQVRPDDGSSSFSVSTRGKVVAFPTRIDQSSPPYYDAN